MTCLFVYGSLKRDHSNHCMLKGGDAEFLAEASTHPKYQLYDCGSFPALVEGGDTSVDGELWRITPKLLKRLDDFEGTDAGLYARRAIEILPSDTQAPRRVAEAYFYARSVSGFPNCGREWIEGHPYWEEPHRFSDF